MASDVDACVDADYSATVSEISEFRSGRPRDSHEISPAVLALLVFFLPPTW